MSIGTTIKNLRREHDMTQEQLADLLGLTPAAISGWECDRNAPDISQIPQLCHIFETSADVLLGIDLAEQEEKIDKIIKKEGTISQKEAVAVYRLALAEFPASWQLMLRLADNLGYPKEEGEDEKSHSARLAEQIALYERVRKGSNDAYYKNMAEGRLCSIYLQRGMRKMAQEIADTVPNLMYSHRDFALMMAEGMDKIYEMHYQIGGTFAELCDNICFLTMIQVDGKPFFTHEQAITLLKKIPAFYEIFFEDGDYLDDNMMLSLAYTRMAEHYADMGDGENAIQCLRSAAKCAKATDEYNKDLAGPYGNTTVWNDPLLPKEKRHTSLLASPELDYPTCTYWYDAEDGEAWVDRFRRDSSHPRFDFVRNEIADIIESVTHE